MRARSYLFALALCLVSTAALAVDRLVATTGTNSGNCTVSDCLTVAYAQGQAVAGDTVRVKGGTYNISAAQTWNGTNGTAGARIAIQPFDATPVIFDGAGLAAGDMVTLNRNYTDVIGFEFRNNATGVAFVLYNTNSSTIQNSVLHGSFDAGVFVGGDTAGQSPSNKVLNNVMYNNARTNSTRVAGAWPAGGVLVDRSQNTVIAGNTIYQTYGEGIIIDRSDGALVSRNRVFDAYSIGIYSGKISSNVVVDSNLVYATGNVAFNLNGDGGTRMNCYSVSNEIASTKFDNWTFTNNIGNGCDNGFIYFVTNGGGEGMTNSKFYNNTFANSQAYGISLAMTNASHSANVMACNQIIGSTTAGFTANNTVVGFTFNNNAWYLGAAGAAAGTGDVTLNPLTGRNARNYSANVWQPPFNSPISRACPKVAAVPARDFLGAARTSPTSIGAFQRVPRTRGAIE